MSEKLNTTPETLPAGPEISVERPKAEYSEVEQTAKVEQARATIAVEASATENAAVPALPTVDDRPQFIDKAIKTLRMRTNLSHVQNKLKPAEKGFSKAVHQPLVQLTSESAAKTITRPSGLLGGGIAAFAGSIMYLILTYRIGLTYNYAVFLVLFVGGFLVGLLAEYALYVLRRYSSR